jgi:serine/threonine protein kinase
MTMLAARTPLAVTARYVAEPTTHHQRGSPTLENVFSSRRGQPFDAAATTGRPRQQLTHPSADGRVRATHPERPADAWPARATDPVCVNDYRLVSRLRAGGMGDVFYAVGPGGGPVAIKILRNTGGALELCRREHGMSSIVDADCTAPALGYGRSSAGAYLVTTYLPGYRCGSTLEGRQTSGRLWTLGSALARVLAAVHARGVVHCDVKPSNLLVRGNDVRVIDFGIAPFVGERCGDDGLVRCSRGWAAPEQLRAASATPAIDVFAWGCLLTYLAGGVHPFFSRCEHEWILRVQSAEPNLGGLPSDLEEVIRRTLARDPRDRPTARELITICRSRTSLAPASVKVQLTGRRDRTERM